MMNFLHPWALGIGAAAVALPLIVHWLTRPRPKKLALSTIRFVLEAIKQRRASHRLRDILVLLMRGLAVVLLALAFARPLSGSSPQAAKDSSAGEVRIVILDVSHSMGAVSHGIALFERARPAAAAHLTSENGLRYNLILAGAAPHAVFDRPATNLAVLTDALSHCSPTAERLNLPAALSAAADMFGQVPSNAPQKHTLFIVSDFQRANWANVDFSVLPKDTEIHLETVAPPQPLENVAILSVNVPGRAEQNRDAHIAVEVGNFAPSARTVQLEFTVAGRTSRIDKICPANSKTILVADVALSAAGWQTGISRLIGVDDALPDDNTQSFALNVRPSPTYLLLTRQPANSLPTSSNYLERALIPASAPGRTTGPHVVRLDAAQLDREALANCDMVVLDHPGKISPASTNLLTDALRRGRSMLYVASEAIDATNLKLISDNAGTNLQLPVEFQPAAQGHPRRDLHLTDVQRANPIFAVFGETLTANITPLRFSGGLATRRLAQGLVDDILATCSDQSAGLVVSSCGSGTLAVLNADLATSNLPGAAAFVPLVGELTNRLLTQRSAAAVITCGDPLGVTLPADVGAASDLALIGPDKSADAGRLVAEENAVVWRNNRMAAPGVYQIQRAGQTVFAVAAAMPAEEADLATLSPTVLQDRLSGGRTLYFHNAGSQEQSQDVRWVFLVTAALIFMCGEIVTLKLFRS